MTFPAGSREKCLARTVSHGFPEGSSEHDDCGAAGFVDRSASSGPSRSLLLGKDLSRITHEVPVKSSQPENALDSVRWNMPPQ